MFMRTFERLGLQARSRSERSGSCTVYHGLEVERCWPILGFISLFHRFEPDFRYYRVPLEDVKGSSVISWRG